MARVRGETYEQRRREIIEGALKVFSTRGFLSATNKEIAVAAGIKSPGLIYHYFADRQELLRAVIEANAPPLKLLGHIEELTAMPLEDALRRLGGAYLEMVTDPERVSWMRVFIGEMLRSEAFANTFRDIGPMRFFQLLADFMQRKMEEGCLRSSDPSAAAICFIGPLAAYMLSRVILRVPESALVEGAALLEADIATFLGGMRAAPASADAKRSTP